MITTIITGMLAALAPVQQTDTTFDVQPGARLALRNPGGNVIVRAWDRNSVRVLANHSSRGYVEINNVGALVRVQSKADKGPGTVTDYEVTVPRSMHLQLSGQYSDFTVEGAGGEVSIETLDGDIKVSGGNERITLESVQGTIELSDARGRMQLETVSSRGIFVSNCSGDVSAETVSGRIHLENVESSNIEATTFSASIDFDGAIHDDGRYWFASHSGSLRIAVPEGTNATVTVGTARGRFSADFPIDQPDLEDRSRFSFTLGAGSATIELETFGGGITLHRPNGDI